MKKCIPLLILCFTLFFSLTVPDTVNAAKHSGRGSSFHIVKSSLKKNIKKGSHFKIRIRFDSRWAAKKGVVFRSSKPSVISVNKKGIVKARKNGKATITVYRRGNKYKKKKFTITVKTFIAKIKITAGSHTCFLNKKLKLHKKIYPYNATNKRVKWVSSNKRIATVSASGIVKGRKTGTVKITARGTDGSKKKSVFKVTVRKNLNPDKYWFTAHRGYSGSFPENTMSSLSEATKHKFKAVETDIWENKNFYSGTASSVIGQSSIEESSGNENDSDESSEDNIEKDTYSDINASDIEEENRENSSDPQSNNYSDNSEFIIMHDYSLNRMCGVSLDVRKLTNETISDYRILFGNGNIKNITYNIPLLDEYLNVMNNSKQTAVIEVKDKHLSKNGAEKLISELDRYNLNQRTYIASFSCDSLKTIQSVLGERTDIKLTRFLGKKNKNNLSEEIKWCSANGITEVSVDKKYITSALIKEIKSRKMLSGAWTVNDKGMAADLIEMGCDHITTNYILW